MNRHEAGINRGLARRLLRGRDYSISVAAQSDDFRRGYSLGYQRGKAKKYDTYELAISALNRMLERYRKVAEIWRGRAMTR